MHYTHVDVHVPAALNSVCRLCIRCWHSPGVVHLACSGLSSVSSVFCMQTTWYLAVTVLDAEHCVHCRQGMQADLTVLDGDMLHVLREGGNHIPAIKATYVSGICSYGCSQSVQESV